MIGIPVRRPAGGTAAATSDRHVMHPAPHPRPGALFGAAVEGALVAALALAVFIAIGVVGNPWYHIVSIKGGSMAPTIERGDLILVTSAPARIEPGMVLVLNVGGQAVTHRVVAVNADGSFVTRGDANHVDDDWGGQPVKVIGRYLATIPWLGAILSVPDFSAASFVDRVGAATTITVGHWPTPHLAAAVRIVPQTIEVTGTGDVTASVERLPAPYTLAQIDLASVELCHQGVCASSHGSATLDPTGQVTASFAPTALAGLVGSDRGDLVLVVQGRLTDGSTFSGQQTNQVTGGSASTSAGTAPVGAAPSPVAAPVASPSPGATMAPSPTDSPTGTPTPNGAPSPSSSPSATPSSSPIASPSPDASSSPTTTPTSSPPPSPTDTPSPPPTPTPNPTAS
jgi:signal peptidase I